MNFYEHTIIARQDTSPSQIKQIQDKYSKIIENNEGNIVKYESWGLMHLSYLIKKNKKGNFLHFKIEGNGFLGKFYINIFLKNLLMDQKWASVYL